MKQEGTQSGNNSEPFGILQQFPKKKEKFEQKYVNNVFKAKGQRLFKNVYDAPFKIDWTPLPKEKTEEILTLLGKHYFSCRIQKKRPREGFVLEKKKDKKRRLREEAEKNADNQPKLEIQEEVTKKDTKNNKKNLKKSKSLDAKKLETNTDTTNATIKDVSQNAIHPKETNEMEIDNPVQILSPKLMHKRATKQNPVYEWPILGLNAVTRALEKNELSLVIICMNVAPGLIQHLPPLCCKNDTSMCVLSETSQNLGKLFGVNSVVAMGFKKLKNYSALVEQISKMCPPVNIPWIKEKDNLLPLSYKYVEHFKAIVPVDKNGSYVAVKKMLGPKIRKPKVQVS